jgi:hypothetical protein
MEALGHRSSDLASVTEALGHRSSDLASVMEAPAHRPTTRSASAGRRDVGHRLRLRPTYPIDSINPIFSARLIGWVLTHRTSTLAAASPVARGAILRGARC